METLQTYTQQEKQSAQDFEAMRAETQRLEKIILDFFQANPNQEDHRVINLCERMGF